MHIAEAGTGPLVILLHGFPESWYSWRHQLTALAAAGYHVVAPDQRGYCLTGGPADPAQYTILHLAGDVLALMDALGEERAVIAGHDWGAPVAWHTALFRPGRVRGVIGLSVPYRPRGSAPPVPTLRAVLGDGFYMVYFQDPGLADTELADDPPATFRRVLSAASGTGAGDGADDARGAGVAGAAGDQRRPGPPVVPPGGGFLDICPEPERLPGWLTGADIETYAAQYAGTGFTGPLNWYRNLDRNWELTAAWQHAPIDVPALFVAGEQDPVLSFLGGTPEVLAGPLPQLAGTLFLPGCGHWVQQEAPDQVSSAMLDFIRALPA
ncbi:MAG TPA: alpha/beta hydrolase [Streptosporangiaceae bacterium]|jgi:pimeloyl-ACP methyl ester carboxylesterase